MTDTKDPDTQADEFAKPWSTETAIRFGLLHWALDNALRSRGDTHIPDSLGDRIFRASLRLALSHTKEKIPPEAISEARAVLAEFENESQRP